MARKIIVLLFVLGALITLAACSDAAPAQPPTTAPQGVPQDIPQGEGITAVPLPGEGTEMPGYMTVPDISAEPPIAACPATVEGVKQFSFELPSVNLGYCFHYPNDFSILGSEIPGQVQFAGPPRSAGAEPVSATMEVFVHPVNGAALASFVQTQLANVPAGVNIGASEAVLGAATPAVVLEGMPGRLPTRQIFAEHNGYFYQIVLSPADPAFPEAQGDMQRFFEALLQSWTFTR